MNSFSISILPWFKASFERSDGQINITSTNSFLCFPAGKTTETIPAEDISSCRLSVYYDDSSIILGIAAIVLAVVAKIFIYSPVISITVTCVLFVLGFLCILSGIAARFYIEKKGTTSSFYVPFYARGKARKVSEWMEHQIKGGNNVTLE